MMFKLSIAVATGLVAGWLIRHYFNVDIGAMLVYNAALSDSDVSSVFTYLNNKYSVY